MKKIVLILLAAAGTTQISAKIEGLPPLLENWFASLSSPSQQIPTESCVYSSSLCGANAFCKAEKSVEEFLCKEHPTATTAVLAATIASFGWHVYRDYRRMQDIRLIRQVQVSIDEFIRNPSKNKENESDSHTASKIKQEELSLAKKRLYQALYAQNTLNRWWHSWVWGDKDIEQFCQALREGNGPEVKKVGLKLKNALHTKYIALTGGEELKEYLKSYKEEQIVQKETEEQARASGQRARHGDELLEIPISGRAPATLVKQNQGMLGESFENAPQVKKAAKLQEKRTAVLEAPNKLDEAQQQRELKHQDEKSDRRSRFLQAFEERRKK